MNWKLPYVILCKSVSYFSLQVLSCQWDKPSYHNLSCQWRTLTYAVVYSQKTDYHFVKVSSLSMPTGRFITLFLPSNFICNSSEIAVLYATATRALCHVLLRTRTKTVQVQKRDGSENALHISPMSWPWDSRACKTRLEPSSTPISPLFRCHETATCDRWLWDRIHVYAIACLCYRNNEHWEEPWHQSYFPQHTMLSSRTTEYNALQMQ